MADDAGERVSKRDERAAPADEPPPQLPVYCDVCYPVQRASPKNQHLLIALCPLHRATTFFRLLAVLEAVIESAEGGWQRTRHEQVFVDTEALREAAKAVAAAKGKVEP